MATVTYQWFKNSNFITQSQTSNQYTFSPVDRYDNGTYTCQATVSSPLLNSDHVRQGSTTIQVTGMLNAKSAHVIISVLMQYHYLHSHHSVSQLVQDLLVSLGLSHHLEVT